MVSIHCNLGIAIGKLRLEVNLGKGAKVSCSGLGGKLKAHVEGELQGDIQAVVLVYRGVVAYALKIYDKLHILGARLDCVCIAV